MSSVNGAGYHYHFISTGLNKRGHFLDFSPERVLVEIAFLRELTIEVPNGAAFSSYQFKRP